MTDLLGTTAPIAADLVAFVEIAMAVVLVLGAFVVRTGRVRLHRLLQSSVIFVNIPIVLAWMIPHYLTSVLPDLPGELGEPYYLVPTLMLALGAIAEGLGITIVLVAGTNLVPERWRFRRYRLWMRTELVLWWAVVVLGLSTYLVWYSGGAAS